MESKEEMKEFLALTSIAVSVRDSSATWEDKHCMIFQHIAPKFTQLGVVTEVHELGLNGSLEYGVTEYVRDLEEKARGVSTVFLSLLALEAGVEFA